MQFLVLLQHKNKSLYVYSSDVCMLFAVLEIMHKLVLTLIYCKIDIY